MWDSALCIGRLHAARPRVLYCGVVSNGCNVAASQSGALYNNVGLVLAPWRL